MTDSKTVKEWLGQDYSGKASPQGIPLKPGQHLTTFENVRKGPLKLHEKLKVDDIVKLTALSDDVSIDIVPAIEDWMAGHAVVNTGRKLSEAKLTFDKTYQNVVLAYNAQNADAFTPEFELFDERNESLEKVRLPGLGNGLRIYTLRSDAGAKSLVWRAQPGGSLDMVILFDGT